MNENLWEVYIGLEIHIHLKTDSKMFCSCPARYGEEPNTQCLSRVSGLSWCFTPGEREGFFSFLPDGKGSELSFGPTYELLPGKIIFIRICPGIIKFRNFIIPVGRGGGMELELDHESSREIRIHDVHLEEDAGKMIHEGDLTLLDYNRAGYPLLEVVTEPDLRSGEETGKFIACFSACYPLS